MATVLLQNGAPRTHQNKHGETATDLARRFGNMKMLDLLKRWEEKEAEAKLKQKQTANREAELKLQAMRKSEADADRRMKERFKQEAIQADAKRKAASNVVLAERAKKEREASMTHSDDSSDDSPHLLWLFFWGGRRSVISSRGTLAACSGTPSVSSRVGSNVATSAIDCATLC